MLMYIYLHNVTICYYCSTLILYYVVPVGMRKVSVIHVVCELEMCCYILLHRSVVQVSENKGWTSGN